MRVLILRGVSGSGKSTYTRKVSTGLNKVVVCSADHYFERSGEYRFNPKELPEAHKQCFRKFVSTINEGLADLIVVDNTNLTRVEVAPYLVYAQAFGCEVEIVRLTVDVGLAAQRNLHGVPLGSIQAMERRFEDLLPYWPKERRF